MPGSGAGSTATRQGAWWSTCSVTEPSRARRTGPTRRVPTTRSDCPAAAWTRAGPAAPRTGQMRTSTSLAAGSPASAWCTTLWAVRAASRSAQPGSARTAPAAKATVVASDHARTTYSGRPRSAASLSAHRTAARPSAVCSAPTTMPVIEPTSCVPSPRRWGGAGGLDRVRGWPPSGSLVAGRTPGDESDRGPRDPRLSGRPSAPPARRCRRSRGAARRRRRRATSRSRPGAGASRPHGRRRSPRGSRRP